MSLNDWIYSNLGEAAPPNVRSPQQPPRDVADIHQRLDSINRQIEQISRSAPRNDAPREQGVARQLNDAISRLDARLSQISDPQYARQAQERQQELQQRQSDAVERAAGQVYSNQTHANQGYSGQREGYEQQGYAQQRYSNQPPANNGYAPQPYRN